VEIYKDVNETDFKKIFNGLAVDKIDPVYSTIKEQISVEFLIASYKHDGYNTRVELISEMEILRMQNAVSGSHRQGT
jgi:argonaute-like protein implicated in RNA metabolism and viral defense